MSATYANKPVCVLVGTVEAVETRTSQKGKDWTLVRISWTEGQGEREHRVPAEAVSFGGAHVGLAEGMRVLLMCSVQFSENEWKGKVTCRVQLRLEDWAQRPEMEKVELPKVRPTAAPKDHNNPDTNYGDIPFALLMALPLLSMVM